MSVSTDRRFIGVDIGTTNSSVCFTSFNSGRQQYDDPEPVRFGNDPTTRSLLLLDPSGQRAVASGVAVYRHPDYLRFPERVHEQFKLRLGIDPTATHYTHLLAGELLKNVLYTIQAHTLEPDGNMTAVGCPAEWERNYPDRVNLVKEAVENVGFPNVEVTSEPVAAMYFHAFLGDIRFEDRPQRWLVVDFGGGTTDLAIVETTESGTRPAILHTYGKVFGGKDFDELLLERLVLARHWSGPPPDGRHRLALLQFVRKFKESFSHRINQGRDRYVKSCQLSNADNNPVTLTRSDFEAEGIGAQLIDRFTGILRDGFLQSGHSLRDIDRIILTGGSARWYFVRQAAEGFFGRETCVISENPELTIAKGLALAFTGFKMPIPEIPELEPSIHSADQLLDAIELTPVDVVPDLDIENCRNKARAIYKKYAARASAIALVVSPIPGISQPMLTALEFKLVTEIADIYGYKLEEKDVMALIGGLLAGGTLLKMGVMEAMTFLPGAGWVLKAGVAGIAIPALGEAVVKYFEQQRFGVRLEAENDRQ